MLNADIRYMEGINMKKRIASFALATVLIMGSVSVYAKSYPSDIDYSRYKEAIEYSYDNEIMKGYPGGLFKPAETMTRGEFATMVARWKSLKLDKDASFG